MATLIYMFPTLVLIAAPFAWALFACTRRRSLRVRALLVLAGEMAIAAGVLWAILPHKLPFLELCSNAGIVFVSQEAKGLSMTKELLEDHQIHRHANGIVEETSVFKRRTDAKTMAVVRTFNQRDGHGGWGFPWMSGQCPDVPDAEGTSYAHPYQLRQLRELLESRK